jgi:hypothetical protein
MKNNSLHRDITVVLEKSLEKVRKNLIEAEKKNNGYLVIADKNGKVKKVPARDL